MKKNKITICIGTVGSPTFYKCKDIIYKNFQNDPLVDKIVIIENKRPQSAWLNEMRKACSDTELCLQVDEDMYLKENAITELLNLYRKKEGEGVRILNASSLLYDLFLEKNIGSLKLWNSEALQALEFRDVLGGDRDFAKRASLLGYQNVETRKVLAEHDSAPTAAIAFSKYHEYIHKLIKFNSRIKAIAFANFLKKKYLADKDNYIKKKAYNGAFKALNSNVKNVSKRAPVFSKKNTSKNINEIFDHIYCLNLDSRKDRWNTVSDKFKELNIKVERFSAYDKNSNEVQVAYKRLVSRIPNHEQRKKKALITSIGAMGCLISHINIIKDAKKNNYNRILILEDDVIFIKNFLNKVKKINNVPDWDLLYLGTSQHSWGHIDTKRSGDLGFYSAYKSNGTFAYAINSSIYNKLLAVFSGLQKPVDQYLCEQQVKMRNAYVIFPNLIIADVRDSDIRGSRDQVAHSKHLRWNLEDYEV